MCKYVGRKLILVTLEASRVKALLSTLQIVLLTTMSDDK